MERCKRVTLADWGKLSEEGKKATVMFHAIAEPCGKDKSKKYIPRELLSDMLLRQVRIACECGLLCNYGERASKKGGVKSYVNCGRNRDRKARALECKYYGQVASMPEDFMWKHAQRIVNRCDGNGTKINEQSAEERVRKRKEMEGEKDLQVCWPCPVCTYTPERFKNLTDEEKAAINLVLTRFMKP